MSRDEHTRNTKYRIKRGGFFFLGSHLKYSKKDWDRWISDPCYRKGLRGVSHAKQLFIYPGRK